MRSLKMPWPLMILFFSFTFNNLLEARPVNKHQSAVIVGTVYCDTCFQEDFSKTSHFISGASVAVECKDGDSKPSFREEVKTDKHGEFKVHLPFSVSKHVKKIEGCSVKLISSSEPYCGVASTATSSSLHLKSRKQGVHIFSAGFFTFKPLKQPILCNQKPSEQNSKELNAKKIGIPTIFPPPIQEPNLPPINQNYLPGLPLLPKLPPLPELPPLPPLPGLPELPPLPRRTKQSKPDQPLKKAQLSDRKVADPDFYFPTSPFSFTPIPFLPTPTILPPPSYLPPIPFLPTPSPLLPNPSPFIPLPPILTPPSLPFPMPQFPFPPIIPPASTSNKASP
ncbi:Pollen_Ole_e_I domain-containing protein [Cephalotus follicularis]|uniref:Pollen_Ole_e_I domain-containing protein n=1 Tax=Cephalotus follicularis TaxID=3775 RepID=A0A1Q3AX14_CEPFO|nr:Pollen_Ole_e_I domain-containing protein [Cephalotus follicularis]